MYTIYSVYLKIIIKFLDITKSSLDYFLWLRILSLKDVKLFFQRPQSKLVLELILNPGYLTTESVSKLLEIFPNHSLEIREAKFYFLLSIVHSLFLSLPNTIPLPCTHTHTNIIFSPSLLWIELETVFVITLWFGIGKKYTMVYFSNLGWNYIRLFCCLVGGSYILYLCHLYYRNTAYTCPCRLQWASLGFIIK